MVTLNRSAIVVLPKQPFLDWLHSVDPTSADLTLEDVSLEPTIYLVPECPDDAAVTECMREVFAEIFEEELQGWYRDRSAWPVNPTFDTFCRWFDTRFHSMLIDLCDDPLIAE